MALEVLVYGLGAIGSFYAFILSRAQPVRLTVVARSNYNAVKSDGIEISSQNHGSHHFYPHQVVKDVAEAGQKYDYIVCAHKAVNQTSVPPEIAPGVDMKRTVIVIIQNGVGNELPFRAAFPTATILSCVTWVGARQPQPGVVTHTQSENMQVGLYPNEMGEQSSEVARLNQFASLLTEGRTVFQVVPNVQIKRWEKVVWNAAWNSLTTLTLMDSHSWLGSSKDAMSLTRRVMTEVIDVANATGVPIEYELVDTLIKKILDMPPIGSSMRADYENGRLLEVDVILGYPVKRGRELGLDIRTLETLYTILVAINERLRAAQ